MIHVFWRGVHVVLDVLTVTGRSRSSPFGPTRNGRAII